jgi:hypothetical protein
MITVAEEIADTVGCWRGSGQTTMLCLAANAYNERHARENGNAVIVTATRAEAEYLHREHGVPTRGLSEGLRYFLGRRDTLFLIDNHVLLQIGDEHRRLVRDLARLDLSERVAASVSDHNEELLVQLDRERARYTAIQETRSRRARRRRFKKQRKKGRR